MFCVDFIDLLRTLKRRSELPQKHAGCVISRVVASRLGKIDQGADAEYEPASPLFDSERTTIPKNRAMFF